MTPGHGYLEALASDNVTVESGSILKITPESIVIVDGTVHQVDAIICATGFDTSFRPAFPVIGDKCTDLRDDWEKEPRSYLSIAAAGYPNFFCKCSLVCPPQTLYSVLHECDVDVSGY